MGRRENGGTEHAAEHGKLALREIDRPRGIEDDVEPKRDETVDRPHHEPREEELQQVGRTHAHASVGSGDLPPTSLAQKRVGVGERTGARGPLLYFVLAVSRPLIVRVPPEAWA